MQEAAQPSPHPANMIPHHGGRGRGRGGRGRGRFGRDEHGGRLSTGRGDHHIPKEEEQLINTIEHGGR